jgi:hypothetical protein
MGKRDFGFLRCRRFRRRWARFPRGWRGRGEAYVGCSMRLTAAAFPQFLTPSAVRRDRGVFTAVRRGAGSSARQIVVNAFLGFGSWGRSSLRIVFPPEPPVATLLGPERRAAGKGAPLFGAAERTLAGEHRSGNRDLPTGGGAGSRSGDSRWWALSEFRRPWAAPATAVSAPPLRSETSRASR